MNFTTLICSKPAAGILEIRLNRPQSLNAIEETVIAELTSALRQSAAETDVRVIILSGEGRAFCAGADYKRHAVRPPSERPAYLQGLLGLCRELYTHPRPVIAAVHGFAIGMGAEMALNCDFIVMTDDAFVRFPEIAIGTFVGGGIAHVLPRIAGLNRAREMVMMSKKVPAAEALAMGLAARLFPAGSFRTDVLSFAKQLAAQAPIPVALAKKAFNTGSSNSYDAAFKAEHDGVLSCMNSSDWHEGVRAFAEKRTPSFTGK
jgi:enoyl-CoA hydratase